jgi:peptidoglycan/LPS O-acetylase OafA/YrhL
MQGGGKGRPRFEAMDLLRGIAALLVMEWHFPFLGGGDPHFGRAYLSVDLFFILSGFVVAQAYHGWLTDGGTAGRFLRVRLIRLYPMYLIAALVSGAFWLVRIATHGTEFGTLGQWAASLVPSLLMLPSPPGWSFRPDLLFPFNALAWSLLYELAVNALYGVLARRLGWKTLAALALLGAAVAGVGAWLTGDNGSGWQWTTTGFGLGRALYGFFAGFIVWRLWQRWPAPAVPSWLLAAVFMIAAVPGTRYFAWTYDLAAVFVLFPLLVWLAASATAPRWLARLGVELGLASYAVYVLQGPILRFVTFGWDSLFRTELAESGNPALATYALIVVAISWILTRRVDEPLRARLNARFVPDRPTPAAQSAP